VSASISGDGERIATVHHDVALRVTDQEERHRHLNPAYLKCAAAEQIERDTRRHTQIVRTRSDRLLPAQQQLHVVQRLRRSAR